MKRQNNIKMADFDYEAVKFHNLIRSTGKWKELFTQKESAISLVVSIGIVVALIYLFKTIAIDDFNELLNNILNIGITTIIGMLGFIISGIAIFTGTITNKLVNSIDADNKAVSLVGILFSFYFIGAIIGINVVGFIFMYLFSYSEINVTIWIIVVVGFLLSYLYIFSIFYSISLIGTCLKLFFVSYRYSDEEKEENK